MKFGIVYKKDDSFLRSSSFDKLRGAGLKLGNEKAHEAVERAQKYLLSKGHQVFGEDKIKNAQTILTFGGDGTLIHKSSQFAYLGVPFVGINTGNLGFLTAAEEKDLEKVVEYVASGKLYLSERVTLDVESNSSRDHLRGVARSKSKNHLGGDSRHIAVNEAVVKGSYRVAELKIHINSEEFLKVSGDGVIVATPTGSTAYSLSSGGSIVDPQINSLIITFINPIGLPIPSVVLSPDDEIEIELVKGDDVSLIIDGQEHEKLIVDQKVKIIRGKHNVKFGYLDKNQFLKSLNAKFGLASRSVGM